MANKSEEVKTCTYCGYISETGEHCTTPGCPGNVAAINNIEYEAQYAYACGYHD